MKFLYPTLLAVAVSVGVLSALPIPALAQTRAPALTDDQRCTQFKNKFKVGSLNIIGDAPVFCSASDLILQVIKYALALAGTVTIFFLILGGYWYLISAGSEELAEKGKKTLFNSVIGLAVIILSYTIVRVVAGTLTALKK